jgi:hypothetical protein
MPRRGNTYDLFFDDVRDGCGYAYGTPSTLFIFFLQGFCP